MTEKQIDDFLVWLAHDATIDVGYGKEEQIDIMRWSDMPFGPVCSADGFEGKMPHPIPENLFPVIARNYLEHLAKGKSA